MPIPFILGAVNGGGRRPRLRESPTPCDGALFVRTTISTKGIRPARTGPIPLMFSSDPTWGLRLDNDQDFSRQPERSSAHFGRTLTIAQLNESSRESQTQSGKNRFPDRHGWSIPQRDLPHGRTRRHGVPREEG